MKHILSITSACLVCLLTLALALPVSFARAEEEKPKIIGPVPAFKEERQEKRFEERTYFMVRYPVFGIKLVDAEIQGFFSAFMQDYDFASLSLQLDETGDAMAQERDASYDLYAARSGLLSVCLYTWRYDSPNPHGFWGIEAFTFDLRANKNLQLKDIFPKWRTAKKLIPLIRAGFEEAHDNGANYEEACPDLDLKQVIVPDNTGFYLEPEGLVLVNSLEFAPTWEWSCSTLSVTKEELKACGANMSYWD